MLMMAACWVCYIETSCICLRACWRILSTRRQGKCFADHQAMTTACACFWSDAIWSTLALCCNLSFVCSLNLLCTCKLYFSTQPSCCLQYSFRIPCSEQSEWVTWSKSFTHMLHALEACKKISNYMSYKMPPCVEGYAGSLDNCCFGGMLSKVWETTSISRFPCRPDSSGQSGSLVWLIFVLRWPFPSAGDDRPRRASAGKHAY